MAKVNVMRFSSASTKLIYSLLQMKDRSLNVIYYSFYFIYFSKRDAFYVKNLFRQNFI